ncbi:MAG: 23S rRNA (pseudouridine(1915)-N(3))-methyltransferase RlmH [Halobacteriovoraceae bacterium]|nr:23S rRNA (pseudouridine(1915)-N(3))-methyltransferase RlmH [Halobacteriovoraceae bacterium]
MKIDLIVIGKVKNKGLKELEDDYLKRLKTYKINIHELKSLDEDIKKEAQNILLKLRSLSNPPFYILSEYAKSYSSMDFACFFTKLEEQKHISLLIGGSAGIDKDLYSLAKGTISLSPLTFPHQLARVLLVEQIYRAETINSGHPYHKQ